MTLEELNEQRKADNLEPLDKLPEPAAAAPAPLDDTAIFAELSKKLGREITSYEDLAPKTITVTAPTEADLEKEREERDNKKISWALESGKVSKKKYESFITDASAPENIVYKKFLQNRKAKNPEMEESEIKAQFESIKEGMGEDVLKEMGEAALHQQYPEIFGIDNEYTSFENKQKDTAAFTQKLQKEAPVYTALTNKIIDGFVTDGITIELPGEDGAAPIKFLYTPDKAKADNIRSYFNDENRVHNAVKDGYKSEEITSVINKALINVDIQSFAKQIYTQATLDKEAALRGIPPANKTSQTIVADTSEEAKIKANKEMANNYLRAQLVPN